MRRIQPGWRITSVGRRRADHQQLLLTHAGERTQPLGRVGIANKSGPDLLRDVSQALGKPTEIVNSTIMHRKQARTL